MKRNHECAGEYIDERNQSGKGIISSLIKIELYDEEKRGQQELKCKCWLCTLKCLSTRRYGCKVTFLPKTTTYKRWNVPLLLFFLSYLRLLILLILLTSLRQVLSWTIDYVPNGIRTKKKCSDRIENECYASFQCSSIHSFFDAFQNAADKPMRENLPH